jgi:uncharacterized repeat protein (TIGR01451 family)
MKSKSLSLRAVSAAAMMLCGPMLATAAETVPPVLGETILVPGAAPLDAAPVPCTGTGTVTCANLRSAIAYANGNDNGTAEAPKFDRIVLDNGSTHTLTVTGAGEGAAATGDLDILSHVTIETANPTDYANKATIAGGEGFADRLLDINTPPDGVTPAAAVLVTLNNLVLTKGQGVFMNGGAIYANDGASTTITRSTITDNFASWDLQDGTGELQGSGGGIYSKGALSVSFSTLSKNTAKTLRNGGLLEGDKIGNGGAIYASQATTVTDSTIGGEGAANVAINGGGIQMAGGNKLEVARSTFSHNDAISGGGINVVSPSAQPFTITNSTFSANHVTDSGAGINTNSSVTILNTTIANNVKDSSNKGSGLNLVGGTATLKNTLLSGNTGGGVSANCGKVGSGALSVVSGGGNLSTDATCNLTLSSDQQSVTNALLGPLALNDNALNGTLTHALLDGSPAIDKGVTDGCPSGDQRGSVRPFDALVVGTKVCDIGAYEVWVDRKDLAITSMVADPTRVEVNSDSTITVTVLNTATTTATGVVLTATLPSGATLTSGTFAGGTCNASGTTVTCSLPDLAPAGLPATVTLAVQVASAGENVVSATVTSAAIDPFPSNNSASVTLVGLTNADLNLTAANVSLDTDEQGSVTLTILNQGAGDAKNVVLTGSVPDGVTLSAISDVALCSISGQAFTCNIPEILANASRAITLTVSSATEGTYTATAGVTGDIIDADATDNTVSATIKVEKPDDGGGCTTNPNARFDGVLLGLVAFALGGLMLRRRRSGERS